MALPITARDQNGLHFGAKICPDGLLRCEHGETYVRAPDLDDGEIAWRNLAQHSDIVTIPAERP